MTSQNDNIDIGTISLLDKIHYEKYAEAFGGKEYITYELRLTFDTQIKIRICDELGNVVKSVPRGETSWECLEPPVNNPRNNYSHSIYENETVKFSVPRKTNISLEIRGTHAGAGIKMTKTLF